MRRDEAQFWREFSERQPRILGALLDATVAGLRNLPQVKLDRPPRLADFALWVSACKQALGMQLGEAMAACQINSAEARDLALEAPRSTCRWPSWPGRASPEPSQNFMPGLNLWSAMPCAVRCAGPRRPTAWVMRSGAWPPIFAPQEWSSSSAATMCRAGAWSPWSVLRSSENTVSSSQ